MRSVYVANVMNKQHKVVSSWTEPQDVSVQLKTGLILIDSFV